MNLLTGQIVETYKEEGVAMARVRVSGAYVRVAMQLLPDARVGDMILIESGVAIAKVENTRMKEASYVPCNSRKSLRD